MKKKIFFILFALVVVFFVARSIYIKNKPLSIEISTAEKGTLVESVSTSGKVKAGEGAVLVFQSGGLVSWVGVNEGDYVRRGQAIAKLDTVVLNAAYQGALNTYRDKQAAAENVLDQLKNHSEDETYSQKATRTAAEVARDNAYDAMLSAKHTLNMATITAPFGGIVIKADPPVAGVNVTAASSGYEIVNPDTMYFGAEVGETDLPKVTLGQTVSVHLDAYPDEEFEGKVVNIGFSGFTSSTGGNAYSVKVSLPKNNKLKFKLGMGGDVDIVSKTLDDVLKAPAFAVIEQEAKNYVWRVEGGKLKKVQVALGASSSSEVQITSGLGQGDKIVSQPASKLKEGQRVK